MAPHALRLHEYAVRDVEILDDAGIQLSHDLAVMAADEFAVYGQVVIRGAADHQASRLEFSLPDRLALVRNQDPAHRLSSGRGGPRGLIHVEQLHAVRPGRVLDPL